MALRYLAIRENSISQGTFANFSAEVQSIRFFTVCQDLSQGNVIYRMATVQRWLRLLQETQAGFNKDDGMEESISGAGLGEVSQL